jgi:hypothetical protein
MFCSPRLVFGDTEGVGVSFHVLHALTHFRRYRGHQVPSSCFALPNSFLAVSRMSDPILMFSTPGYVFGVAEGVESHFNVLRSQERFQQYMFPGPVFMICTIGLIFDGTEGVGSQFHVFHFRTSFLRYGRRRVPFSCFARPNSF